MAAVATCGTTAAAMMENGTKTKSTESATISGLMVASTTACGRTTICMVRAFTLGKTAENMRVSTLMTENTALVSTPGKTDANTKATGSTASSMAKASIARRTSSSDGVAGRKVNAHNGLRTRASLTPKTEKNFTFNQQIAPLN